MTKEIVHIKIFNCDGCPMKGHDGNDFHSDDFCQCPGVDLDIEDCIFNGTLHPDCPLRSKMFVVMLEENKDEN